MLQSLKELYGEKLNALDGEIGHVKDFYFDDQSWAVRYVVAETGTWLTSRQVLLSPLAFGTLYQDGKDMLVNITKKQIEVSPSIELHKPVSRQYEEEYHRYYGWPYYWEGDGLWGGTRGFPILELPPKFASVEPPAATGPKPKRGDAHLRSTQAVNGYHLQATDGITGHVCGFLMDAKSWAINQIVIKIGHRFTGKEVQISVSKVTEISYDASKVFVNLTTDAGGKPISNSPPVMFTIESGPGEFPTGRTITFDETIDNPIRDGQAAIEFRSYYGGETIIRATSPGLKAATLKITTRGEPPFVAGRTPVAPDRPYVRFVRPEDFTAPGNQNVAYNRPTGASSEAPGHNGSRAVDGDANTYWSASDEQPGAWWQVDLEQPHSITAVQTTFPAAGNYRYRLEGSINGNSWTLLADNSQTDRAEPVRTDKIPSGQRVQIVRLTFTGLPVGTAAALAEVKITGQVAAQ